VAERDLNVVVFGATGITGRRVAEYLAARAPELDASWAAAGRSAEKVKSVLADADVTPPEIVVADVGDRDSLAEMASRARVVLNLVGPYTRYARPVIEACVAAGTHYADLTGEIPFAREAINAFHAPAAERNVKVIEICGFEALPPDLATLLAVETARERHDEALADVEVLLSIKQPPGLPRPSDILSGGTLQSMGEMIGAERSELLADPAALVPDPARAVEIRARSPIRLGPRRAAMGGVVGPMAPAAFINPPVIHRTAALLAAEGQAGTAPVFRYSEGFVVPGSPATAPFRYAAAAGMAVVQAGALQLARAPVAVRQRAAGAIRRLLPGSGFGPSDERLEAWSWRMEVVGRTPQGKEVRVRIDGDGQPGYLTTARMLGEAGLLLSEPGSTPERAGCLTPATALGTDSIERFERAGLRFSVSP
jgi:short subunit dehydrogenase-like uncharacterized protein